MIKNNSLVPADSSVTSLRRKPPSMTCLKGRQEREGTKKFDDVLQSAREKRAGSREKNVSGKKQKETEDVSGPDATRDRDNRKPGTTAAKIAGEPSSQGDSAASSEKETAEQADSAKIVGGSGGQNNSDADQDAESSSCAADKSGKGATPPGGMVGTEGVAAGTLTKTGKAGGEEGEVPLSSHHGKASLSETSGKEGNSSAEAGGRSSMAEANSSKTVQGPKETSAHSVGHQAVPAADRGQSGPEMQPGGKQQTGSPGAKTAQPPSVSVTSTSAAVTSSDAAAPVTTAGKTSKKGGKEAPGNSSATPPGSSTAVQKEGEVPQMASTATGQPLSPLANAAGGRQAGAATGSSAPKNGSVLTSSSIPANGPAPADGATSPDATAPRNGTTAEKGKLPRGLREGTLSREQQINISAAAAGKEGFSVQKRGSGKTPAGGTNIISGTGDYKEESRAPLQATRPTLMGTDRNQTAPGASSTSSGGGYIVQVAGKAPFTTTSPAVEDGFDFSTLEKVPGWEQAVEENMKGERSNVSGARLGQLPVNNVSLRKHLLNGLTQKVMKAAGGNNTATSQSWQKHNVVLEDGKEVHFSSRQSDGLLQLKIGSRHGELNKLLQQHQQEIRQHLEKECNLEIDLQFENNEEQGLADFFENTSPGARTGKGPASGEKPVLQKVNQAGAAPVRRFGYNQMEWTA